MGQEVMNELVNMSQEIIKLKDQNRELLNVLKNIEVAASADSDCDAEGPTWKAISAASAIIYKAEGAQ